MGTELQRKPTINIVSPAMCPYSLLPAGFLSRQPAAWPLASSPHSAQSRGWKHFGHTAPFHSPFAVISSDLVWAEWGGG